MTWDPSWVLNLLNVFENAFPNFLIKPVLVIAQKDNSTKFILDFFFKVDIFFHAKTLMNWTWTLFGWDLEPCSESIFRKKACSVLIVRVTDRKALLPLDSTFKKLEKLLVFMDSCLHSSPMMWSTASLGIGLWPGPQHHCNPLVKESITRWFRQFVTWQDFPPNQKYFLSFIFWVFSHFGFLF